MSNEVNSSETDISQIEEKINGLDDDLRHHIQQLRHKLQVTENHLRTTKGIGLALAAIIASLVAYIAYDEFIVQEPIAPLPELVLPVSQTPVEAFADAENFVVYYGQGLVGELAGYDVAIIQPQTLSDADLRLLNNSGTVTLAYLSVGEAESERDYYRDGRFDEDWVLGTNDIWGSEYVDVSEEEWQELIIELAGQYIAQGFRGVFLDTVDTVDLFPNMDDDMVQLITTLRETYPNMVMIQNRGFSVLDETAPVLDGVMFESMSTSYNFETETYFQVEESVNQNLIQTLQQLQSDYDLQVLALNYAPIDNQELIDYARENAIDNGFLASVSEITLQSIYPLN
ncbi:MAG: endo alpha-1,4 polygalactosaminidase [Chloroflexota bacterium]